MPINSILDGTNINNNQMKVSIIIKGGSLSGYVGHAHMLFEWVDQGNGNNIPRKTVYHLVGNRNETSPGRHIISNVVSIEKIETEQDGTSRSKGGATNRLVSFEREQDTNADWLANTVFTSVITPLHIGEAAMNICADLATEGDPIEGIESQLFSLLGANIGIGTNCITFALQVLSRAGIRVSRTLYVLSFFSPFLAITAGELIYP